MAGLFDRSGVNTGSSGEVFSDTNYSDVNTGGSGQLFPDTQYVTDAANTGVVELYALTYDATTQKLVLTDSQGATTEVDAGSTEIGFRPFGHSDHSGADNEGEIVLGRDEGIIYRMVVGLEEADAIPSSDDNSFIDKDATGGELVFQLSSLIQAGDKRPPTSEAVNTAVSTLGPGDHITTTGTGDYVTGVTVNEAGNVTALSLNDGDTVLRNIGAQQAIDGVFFASTPAQRAMDPPRGELAFYANVGGTPTREHTQPLEVIGMRGSGTAVHTFDDGASLWFEVEIVGAGEGGGGGGTPVFATSDDWEAQDDLTLQLDEYVSTDEDYVPVRADAELRAAGYEAGDSFFITERDIEYQVIITDGNFALQYVISNRDTIAELSGGQGVLDDISDNTTNIATNTADIESVVQHNHEQDARIAALENQDFTTTISSFTESTTLSNLFTSGTIINKGNAGSNLYQAWTVTREGHELIGYLQLTDTERDSFRNEFSLIQGANSNIYIPANPDSPHTIGIKAFPAADFNDLSSSTQVLLGQVSSMRFGGNVGSETMFEIRWELINYSDAIDTGLGTVDSGEIYGAAGDKRYAFLAPTIYTAPAWEFREATVSRTEIISTGTSVGVNSQVVDSPVFLDNNDADGIHFEVSDTNKIKANINHLPGAAYNQNFTYRPGDEVTFNSTVYLSTTNISGNHPPIDGGSSNNVFHGVGAIPNGMAGTGAGQFAWRIAKAGIVIGNYDPDTGMETDEVTAESLHFNTDHFTLTPDLTTGDEIIALNPDAIGSGLVKSVTNTTAPNSWNATTGALNVTSNTGAEVTAEGIEGIASQVADDTWGIGQIGNLTEQLAGKETLIVVQSAPPETPTNGLKWVHSDTGDTYVYNAGNWIQIAGQGEQVPQAAGSVITLDGGVVITSAGTGADATVTFSINGTAEMRLSSAGLVVRGEITGNNGNIS